MELKKVTVKGVENGWAVKDIRFLWCNTVTKGLSIQIPVF